MSSGTVGRPLIARQWQGALASSVLTRSHKDVDCAGMDNGALAPSVADPCSCNDEARSREDVNGGGADNGASMGAMLGFRSVVCM